MHRGILGGEDWGVCGDESVECGNNLGGIFGWATGKVWGCGGGRREGL